MAKGSASVADTSTQKAGSQAVEQEGAERIPGQGRSTEVVRLQSDRGRTSIADGVVAKIAGIAARDISGVYALGSGAARAFAAGRQRVPGGKPNVAQGVNVEVGEKQCAVDLAIVVEYGVPIAELAAAVRENVITSVERMTALEVVEVNIAVDDIHISYEDDNERQLQ
ncbi:MAG: Asp23/Gls24 family envelope stress response protein [Streptomycetaceae bacterium]|nr:Asp23/Gls24 family envelope stress response protein [Streptomycetaceae bacterium]